ncbi:MAG: thiamine ABC transporter substrate-binding protein [Actinomycetota bacterium]|nr:thiamine ABC transporter substrate-binding protein [Actinomycetota bacterium]
MNVPRARRFTATLMAAALLASCGDDDPVADTSPTGERQTTDVASTGTTSTESPGTGSPGTEPPGTEPVDGQTITLVTYDSFPESDTPVNEALGAFSEEMGIDVELLLAGDTGTMVSKAALTAGNPEGDVMWGVDNTFLSRAVDEGVFEPYTAEGLDAVDTELLALVPGGEATPVDYGDVCVNYDIAWFDDAGLAPPETLEDLTDGRYADLLVVENPATSSPGMAFLLATIARFGEDEWPDYWRALRDNGVEVVDGWNQAYYERFTWAGGPKPLVVSYGSSPPAEVIFADPPRDDAPTGVVTDTCFRQVEYAGVLAGTEHPDEARLLVDFLLSAEFQDTLALNLFVYPANEDVELPPEFVEFAAVPDDPAAVDPEDVAANRSDWVDTWTEVTLR